MGARDKFINIGLIVAVVLLLAVLALWVRVIPVPDKVAVFAGKVRGQADHKIVELLQGTPGVASVEVGHADGQLIVQYDSKVAKDDRIVSAATASGYPCNMAKFLTVQQYAAMTGKDAGAGSRHTCNGGCLGRN